MAKGSEEPRRRGPHPLLAAALSVVWPGLGHFGHDTRRGLMLASATLVTVVIGLVYTLTRGVTTLLAWSVTRLSLQVLIAGVLCVLVFRVVVTVDAYRTVARGCRPQHWSAHRRFGTLAMLVLLAVIVAVPHVIAIRFAVAQLGLLSGVFDATDTQTAIATPVPITIVPATLPLAATTGLPESSVPVAQTTSVPSTMAPSTTVPPPARDGADRLASAVAMPESSVPVAQTTSVPSTMAPSTTVPSPARDGADRLASAVAMPESSVPVAQTTSVPSTMAPSTTVPSPARDGADRLTIALLGGDGGFGRTGVRTDTIIVLSIDTVTGDAAAFNVPRNWSRLTFPDGTPASQRWPDGYPDLANAVYGAGLRFPGVFPGVEDTAGHAIKSALAQLTGLPIQYYVLVDMVGFVDAIDLFGGIDIHVTEAINDRIKPIEPNGPHIDIVVKPGDYHFDGLTALGYVRSRTTSSDYHRMTRQRCVVEALIDQITLAEMLANFLALTDIISDHIKTDIPLDRLNELIILGDKLDTSRIVTVNFIPPEFPRGRAPITRVREAVTQALQGATNQTNSSLVDSCHGPQGLPHRLH